MHTRRAVLSDSEEIAALRRESILRLNGKDYGPDVIDEWIENATSEDIVSSHKKVLRFVAIENEIIVGFAELRKKDNHLRRLYVHPDWTRKGIGSALLKKLEEEAVKRGATTFTFESSITAKPFYEARDYTVIEAKKVSHSLVKSEKLDALHMEKILVKQ